MATDQQNKKLNVFISYARKDKDQAKRLEKKLIDSDIDVWVDYNKIRGGDNLPAQISEALERCNALLLLWSEDARKSKWVKLESSNAISLEKEVIPCKLDSTKVPAILSNKVFLNFHSFDEGIKELWPILKKIRQSIPLRSEVLVYFPGETTPIHYYSEKVVWSIHGRLAR